MTKRRIKRNFDEQAALVLENSETTAPKKRQWRKNAVWKKEDQDIERQSNKLKDPPIGLASTCNHLEKAPAVKRNQPRQFLPKPHKRINWRYNRVWRKDMVWKREEKTSQNVKKAIDQVDMVVSPKTKHDVILLHEETTPSHEEPVSDKENVMLKDCSSLLKRKRQASFVIPNKKRLLEAIPMRSVQPYATPHFLWNLETEMEWCCDLLEDLHL